jgi:hypothetical protein
MDVRGATSPRMALDVVFLIKINCIPPVERLGVPHLGHFIILSFCLITVNNISVIFYWLKKFYFNLLN